MKKIIIFLLIFLSISKYSYCAGNINNVNEINTEDMLNEQQNEFKINEFIKNAQNYGGDFFEDINIKEILNNAIKGELDNTTIFKKAFSIFKNEFSKSLKTIGSILIIVIISAILKSIGDGLENTEISKLIYYVQYILIVTIIMANFSDIVKMVQDTTNKLTAFMQLLIPLLMSLMIYTGGITTSNIIEPIILVSINIMSNMIQMIIIPLILVFASLVIISKISDQIQIDKLVKFLKSGIVIFLSIILTIFVSIVSLEGTLSSSIDGITAKTGKAIVSSAVPIVGKILGDAVDTVLGCGVILKNAVGLIGVLVTIGICCIPIIKLSILTIVYKLASVITQSIAEPKISSLLDETGEIFKIFLSILFAISFMLIIGIALVVKMSNGMIMYR